MTDRVQELITRIEADLFELKTLMRGDGAANAAEQEAVIKRAVCMAFAADERVFTGRTRTAHACEARFAFIWLLRRKLKLSFPNIADRIKHNHGTAMHGVNRAEALMNTPNDRFRKKMSWILKQIPSFEDPQKELNL